MMQTLITGCGRSGTRYMTEILHKCKVNIGHEKVKGRGTVSWMHAPQYKEFNLVLRQLRNPRLVASSFGLFARLKSSWQLVENTIKDKFDVDVPYHKRYPLEAGVIYTYFWNKMLDENADYTYRIEDISKELPKILKLMNVSTSDSIVNKAVLTTPRIGNRMVKKGRQYYTWDDIEKVPYGTELMQFADKWGYL